jgi:16S rRNA processing protein RimM
VNTPPERHPTSSEPLRDPPSAPELIEAGRVGRPHGLDGSFHVTRPDARLLALSDEIYVRGRPERIERRAGTAERPILRLTGHGDRHAAAALRGAPLAIPAESAPALAEGEYWAHELEGCAVWDGARRVGEVRRMLPLPSCEALEVARDEGGDVLVPMVRDAIRSVDVRTRRIDVDLSFLGE